MSIEKRLTELERGHSDKQRPGYIVIRDRIDGPLTVADLQVLAGGRVRLKGYVGVSPDDWPPAPPLTN